MSLNRYVKNWYFGLYYSLFLCEFEHTKTQDSFHVKFFIIEIKCLFQNSCILECFQNLIYHIKAKTMRFCCTKLLIR